MQKSGLCPPARQKRAKKRSLHGVNEHFEPVFNAAGGCRTDFCIWLRKVSRNRYNIPKKDTHSGMLSCSLRAPAERAEARIPTGASCKSRIVLHNKAKTDEKAEFIGNK